MKFSSKKSVLYGCLPLMPKLQSHSSVIQILAFAFDIERSKHGFYQDTLFHHHTCEGRILKIFPCIINGAKFA